MTVPAFFEADTQEMMKELMGRGVLGGLFFTVDDIQSTFEELKSRGVEFSQEPTQQPYGIDAGFRDPSGNAFRMMQAPDAA
jgi:predicted enzyme related to lactoylglutathione lyase